MPFHQFNLSIELTAEEEQAIADTIGCEVDNLDATLAPYFEAAMREYADMFDGQAMTTAATLREHRLLSILLALPPDNFPSDDTISRLFSLTGSAGRALLRNTLSRHRNKLVSPMHTAATRFLNACEQNAETEEWEGRFPNAVLIEKLNAELAVSPNTRSPIRRKSGTFDFFIVPNGSYQELRGTYP